jgi:hypothetical protein
MRAGAGEKAGGGREKESEMAGKNETRWEEGRRCKQRHIQPMPYPPANAINNVIQIRACGVCVCVCVCVCVHYKHTYIHTYIRMYIHTCIHTYREREREKGREKRGEKERERKREKERGREQVSLFELNKEELEGGGWRINSATMDKHPELHLHLDLQLYLSVSPVL